jgi:Putative auto-transporter adhesin, head GIN domain
MKKSLFILALIITSTLAYSQKKEKVKGSKIVTTEKKQIESFDAIEVADNLEIFLVKGDENEIEIEADDNLHQAIDIALTGTTLRLSTLKDISAFKTLKVRVIYTDALKSLILKDDAQVTAITDLQLDTFSIKCLGHSKAYINAKTTNFEMQCDDKAKVDLNLKSTKTIISLSKNCEVKALINSTDLVFDLYQKSTAEIEGEVENLKLRLDNDSKFTGKNLTAKLADVTTELYTSASIQVTDTLTLTATGKSEVELYGAQKITINRFEDSAVLKKKPLK